MNYKVTFGPTKLGERFYCVSSTIYRNKDYSFIKSLKKYYKCCKYTKIIKIEKI